MEILRTPEKAFANLKDYPYEPCYTTISTHDDSELRIHHIDVGPEDGPTILCMHGQPVWSYLYTCLLYTSPSPRDLSTSRMPSSA